MNKKEFIDELVEFFRGILDSPERAASAFSDYMGLINMLSVLTLHGLEIKIRPYDQNPDLVRQSANGHHESQIATEERDNNLYESLVRESNGDDITRILYTGHHHLIEGLRASSLLDPYLIRVGIVDSALTVLGALPYEEGIQDPDELKNKITGIIRRSGLEMIVDFNMVPRQLAVNV